MADLDLNQPVNPQLGGTQHGGAQPAGIQPAGTQPAGLQATQGGPGDTQQTLVPPKRRRTHLDGIIDALKKLPLPLKLKRNKKIEEQNYEKMEKALQHSLDPVAHPDDASSAASFITVTSKEIASLDSPSVFASVRDFIPYYITSILRNREPRDKRRVEADDEESFRLSKRRCMDGDTMVDSRQIGATPLFPQVYFDTANAGVVIPLPLFLPKHVAAIAIDFPQLDLKRINGPDGSKGKHILDFSKIPYAKELSITYSEFCIAADQMIRFESQRDKEEGGTWTESWWKHFSHFKRPEAGDLYDEWKSGELDIRRSRLTQHVSVAESKYDNLLQHAAFAKSLKDDLNKKPQSRGAANNGSIQGSQGLAASRINSKKSFQGGSGRRSAPAICILCAEPGHTVFDHPSPDKPAKFPDGKPAWAKIGSNGRICTPEGKEICIKFNTHGKERCEEYCTTKCNNRLHACSFCGSRTHHAFSWNCRSNGTN
ncbi:hypothetical protein AN958_08945 [Leucoagaricus sp. SymC.cos]|nr:hypothetical protein AN958_08945 [Leucoagaricus sp. SymC.cos]